MATPGVTAAAPITRAQTTSAERRAREGAMSAPRGTSDGVAACDSQRPTRAIIDATAGREVEKETMKSSYNVGDAPSRGDQ
ncbi:hypothetical protein [Nocardia vulneris]|uniref:hypothetical protein n=1 Tax=Nocardia vulneris TaxID=1141657 RepID=UPI0012E07EDA|nr:hypothetical protein [Nocardia vulneris]